MEDLIKEIKDISNKFDKLMKDEIGYTMEEMLKLKGEDFEKTADSFVEKVLKKLGDKKEISKADVKEKENGQYLKIYEAETKYGIGIAIEGQGKVSDMLFYGAKGLGQLIKQNKHIFNDVDDLVDTLCKQIKDEIKGGE